MLRVYYWLQNKSALDILNRELQKSSCKGFYINPNLFDKLETRESHKDSLQLLNKEILLNFNFTYSLRPSLLSDSDIIGDSEKYSLKEQERRDKLLAAKHEKFTLLRKLANNKEEARNLVQLNYKYYEKTKEYLESPLDRSIMTLNEILGKILRNPIKVLPFEFPYIALPSEKDCAKNSEIREISDLCKKVNSFLFEIQIESSQYKECFFTLCLSIEDILEQNQHFKILLNRVSKFPNLLIWIINFNEIYAPKIEVNAFVDFLNIFTKFEKVIFKFSGIFSHRMIELTCEKYHSIIRLDGYPGQNINMLGRAKQTRKLFDSLTGDYLSVSRIGPMITSKNDTFQCECSICNQYGIDNYAKANELYLSENPATSSFYKPFIGNAKKTRKAKIRRIQNQYLLKHCFTNVNKDLSMLLPDFQKKFIDISRIFRKWNPHYKSRIDNDE